MARTAFTHRSIRTVVQAVPLVIVATLALGACGSEVQARLVPVEATASTAPGGPVATAAPAAKVAAIQNPAAATKKSARPATHTEPPSAALHYVKIVEPFSSPGRCYASGTTIEMTACILRKVVEVDHTVDVLQNQKFFYSISKADQKATLRDNARWLTQRTKTCSENRTGGSIDQITAAECLLKAGQARVASLS